ncbi:MAG: NAD(P)/FAD-dependent oxidoreductase [Hyphomicrobiaceae bacterium]|nr:NAD(P)/FAD-dependent oxidoreductase [Hyphomicrobiaceae bacterium]
MQPAQTANPPVAAAVAVHVLKSAPLPSQTTLHPLPTRPHIVVVGGGAGGLELVTKLGRKYGRSKKADITLIDRSRTHVWKPLLHEIAAGSMDPDRHELDYLAQAHWHGFTYRFGELIGLDRTARKVTIAANYDDEGRPITPERSFTYDILVIAIGSVSNDFGTPGVWDYAIRLDTPVEAERFNRRLVNACLYAHTQSAPIRPGQLHVTIIGAGATGTELAAELHRTARGVVAYGMDNIDPDKDIEISLIEAAPRILPALPEKISNAVLGKLQELKVDVRTNSRVTRVTKEGVELQSGETIPSELVVWAAGVKGPDVLTKLDGLELSRSNQLVVAPTLETSRDANIFALGDCCWLIPEGGDKPIPPRAQAAHQQADHMIAQIQRRMRGEPLKPFVYRDFGSLISLGHYSTVGSLMGFIGGRSFFFEGLFAKLMYRSLYKMHEVALHGYFKVGLDTLSRLITRRTDPVVKLH